MAAIDMSRLSAGVNLRPKVAAEIWKQSLDESAIARLVPKMTLPGEGVEIDFIATDPEAEWVGETEEKPVGKTTFGTKTLKGYKMALIELFSDEFKRDKNALYREIAARLPKSMGNLLDKTVLTAAAGPGPSFDVLSDAPALALGTPAQIGDNVLAVNAMIAAAGGELSGWALSPQGKAALIGAKDPQGSLLFTQDYTQGIALSRILGEPVYTNKKLYQAGTPNVVGIAGDWSQARLGIIEGVRLAATDQATVNYDGVQVNLWQRNMFALRVEMEVGFVVNNKNAFVRLTQA